MNLSGRPSQASALIQQWVGVELLVHNLCLLRHNHLHLPLGSPNIVAGLFNQICGQAGTDGGACCDGSGTCDQGTAMCVWRLWTSLER